MKRSEAPLLDAELNKDSYQIQSLQKYLPEDHVCLYNDQKKNCLSLVGLKGSTSPVGRGCDVMVFVLVWFGVFLSLGLVLHRPAQYSSGFLHIHLFPQK